MTKPTSTPSTYTKHHSFAMFHSNIGADIETQRRRAIARVADVLNDESEPAPYQGKILRRALDDLQGEHQDTAGTFGLTPFIADEMSTLTDADIPRYIFHRYRYDVFPITLELDDYPPYLQIEPASICNFRCIFCYQTDASFASNKSGQMGKMSIELFKEIVDQVTGHIEFGSLASRGEPTVNRHIGEMCRYCEGKFLGMKLNTNASMLDEAMIHDILAGGIRTVVFSADAAEEPMYSEFRVKGSLERTLKNIALFRQIRESHYPNLPVITRVSGVMYDEKRQNMESMIAMWSDYVDQIAFVSYNPWENIYETEPNGIEKPCSDLWRRMFIWYDGKVNPCDTDYKSTLSRWDINDQTISSAWRDASYQSLRDTHVSGRRQELEPCRRCVLV